MPFPESIVRSISNPGGSHPMHLHGYNFFILHEGPGLWDGTIVRPQNPHRRDVHLVRGNGHLVVQFGGNPGKFGDLSDLDDSWFWGLIRTRRLGVPLPRRMACLWRFLRLVDRRTGQGREDAHSAGCREELQGMGPIYEAQRCRADRQRRINDCLRVVALVPWNGFLINKLYRLACTSCFSHLSTI